MDGGNCKATVHGVAKSQTWLSHFTFTFHFHALEKEMETHSNVLAWKNPRDGRAWWAAVYWVAQSRTQLKQLNSSSSSRRKIKGLSNIKPTPHQNNWKYWVTVLKYIWRHQRANGTIRTWECQKLKIIPRIGENVGLLEAGTITLEYLF